MSTVLAEGRFQRRTYHNYINKMYKIKSISDTFLVAYIHMCPFLLSVLRMLSSSCELFSEWCGNLSKNVPCKCTVRINAL